MPSVRSGDVRAVAVDLPSGLHPDDGTTADGLVLPAAVTVTFGGVKLGLTKEQGPALSGAVVWVEFGFPFAFPPPGAAEVAYAVWGLPEGE
jgi:NAD(P)H-hydrate epimerase